MANDPWSARIDWPKVLDDIAYLLGEPQPGNELIRVAVSQEKLAASLRVPRGTLRNWIDGSEPRHSDGEAVIVHWERLTGKARTFIHVTHYAYSAGRTVQTAVRQISKIDREHGQGCLAAG